MVSSVAYSSSYRRSRAAQMPVMATVPAVHTMYSDGHPDGLLVMRCNHAALQSCAQAGERALCSLLCRHALGRPGAREASRAVCLAACTLTVAQHAPGHAK